MCSRCLNSHCHDRNRVCGSKLPPEKLVEGWGLSYDKEGNPVYSGSPPMHLAKKKKNKLSCEYCGVYAGRTKGIRTVDFVFKRGVQLCLECASKPRCEKCDGELSRLGCMLCRNDIRNVLNKG